MAKKILLLFFTILCIAISCESVFAASISSFSKSESIFEFFDATVSYSENINGISMAYFYSVGRTQNGSIVSDQKLNAGDNIIVLHLKGTNKYSLLKKHQTDTYLVDIQNTNSNNKYIAIVMNKGEKISAEIDNHSVNQLIVGQDVKLQHAGNRWRVMTAYYKFRTITLPLFVIAGLTFVVFGYTFFNRLIERRKQQNKLPLL